MAPLDGGNFQGINPSMLQQLIKSLSSGVTGAQPLANSYVGQFNRVGLDTGPIQKLLADYAWASQQQPMLQRRYSLASHQPSGDFTDGWTEEGAGALFFTTTAAAKNAGTADAKQMQAYLDAHDWSGIQKELDAMAQNGDDADYMAAFFSQLGPKGLYALSGYAQGGASSDAANEQEVQQIVGAGLATASYEMPLTMSFLQGMEPENPPPDYSTEVLPGGWDSGALAPFLTEGEFSDQWLQTMAPSVLYQKDVEMGAPLPGGYDAIFTAMANNPQFAAKFYQQNSGQLDDYMTDPVLSNILTSDQGFGKFLEAATIPPQGDTDTTPFTKNATTFVKALSGGADTSDTVRQVMGAVTVNYFTDVVGTVTAAAKGAGSTMGLNADEWGAFVQEAMKDKTTAAYLLTFYSNWRTSQPSDSLPTSGQGDGSTTPYGAGYWHDQSFGALDYFFASNYKAAGATAGDDGGGIVGVLRDALNSGAGTLLASVAFSAVAGPEAGAALITTDMLTDAGEDAFSSVTESGLDSAENSIGQILASPAPAPDTADGVAQDLNSVQYLWSSKASQLWNEAVAAGPGGTAKDFPPVHYNGQPYTGDPKQYEQEYGGTFLEANGTIKPTDQMNAQALAAYNAWLQDPAIVKTVAGAFSTETQGADNSLYSALMNGGGSGG